MYFLLFIIIPLLNQHQVYSSPVLLWSNAKLPDSSVSLLTHAPLDIISNHICKIQSEKIQIHLFMVDKLTNEEIQRGSQSKHPLSISAKNEQSQFRYFPHVSGDVYKAFSSIPASNNAHCARIHFQTVSSTDYDSLKQALDAMQASVDSIDAISDTAVVMALIKAPTVPNSLSRARREANAQESVLVSGDRSCMFYAEALYWQYTNEGGPQRKNFTLNLANSSCVPYQVVSPDGNKTSAVLNLSWKDSEGAALSTILIANITGLYWTLEKAQISGSEYRHFAYGMHSLMDTPPTYSYVCKSAFFVKYNSSTKYGIYDFNDKFYLSNLQFQPFRGNGSYFGPPNYCTSFFTSGIWMGITSSLLCLGILLFGIYRMMNIKPNDRFDDPKGKPLIIKAQE